MSSHTVLFVEDVETCREPIACSLRRAGYKVVCANTVRQALKSLEETSPDLLLLDLALPQTSGFELIETLGTTDHWRTLPVIIFTASGDVSRITAALGVSACLIKSLTSMDDIKAAIAQAIAGK